jgi:hypothetical protein
MRQATLKDAVRAQWRGTTPVNPTTGTMGVFFDTAAGVVRLEIDEKSAEHLSASVQEFLQARRDS